MIIMLIQKNISLREKVWFKTGGKSKFYSEPQNIEDLKTTLQFARKNRLPLFILGSGANVLISDKGFNGLTVKPLLSKISFKKNLVIAECGTILSDLIATTINQQLIGLEDFAGIPSTIGGAFYFHLHYFDKFISNFLHAAQIIDLNTLEIYTVPPEWFEFGYDKSKLQNKKFMLLSVTLKLKKVSKIQAAYAKGWADAIEKERKFRYPTTNTCGSFFKNFSKEEINFKISNQKITSVAYYLEKIGVKGSLKIGGAFVSHKHANMIETDSSANSKDIIKVAKLMQTMVFEKYKIVPQPECQLIGFDKYPLLLKPSNLINKNEIKLTNAN